MAGLNSTYTGATLIESGVASVGNVLRIKYVRFSPLAMRVGGLNYGSGCQFSEFQLLLQGELVTYPMGSLGKTFPEEAPNTHEGPELAIDGNAATKFYRFPAKPLIVEMPEAVLFDGYRWYTADDSTGRDALAWTVAVSEDGRNWTTVDSRDYPTNTTAITTERQTLAGAWNIATHMNVLSDLSRTTIADSAELELASVSETIGPLRDAGKITLDRGTLGLNTFEDEVFDGSISGTGAIVKRGAYKQSLSGAIDVIGEIVVEAGALDLNGAVLTGITNIVIKTGGELTGTATVNGDLTVTFEGGAYSGTLALTGALAVNGTVTLALREGANYPVHQTIFTYSSIDQGSQDALTGATMPSPLPAGILAKVRVTGGAAYFVAAAAGTHVILR